jgi:hypothetical protein
MRENNERRVESYQNNDCAVGSERTVYRKDQVEVDCGKDFVLTRKWMD